MGLYDLGINGGSGGSGGFQIDDTKTSQTTAWSSSRTENFVIDQIEGIRVTNVMDLPTEGQAGQ
ncbi:hypothetical protein U6M79_12315, partial [Cutibacterium acnes]